ncbi:Hypothetical_protein [Hexamita inflata]|uniref:Hypothetical_protein n=1 Tax=Hexamita inflata TaxID=28002 RepID=A0AA86TUY9_9EUKA|nr:Hypothetical protein HINF_LOCUS15752 [Hexamita inflata]
MDDFIKQCYEYYPGQVIFHQLIDFDQSCADLTEHLKKSGHLGTQIQGIIIRAEDSYSYFNFSQNIITVEQCVPCIKQLLQQFQNSTLYYVPNNETLDDEEQNSIYLFAKLDSIVIEGFEQPIGYSKFQQNEQIEAKMVKLVVQNYNNQIILKTLFPIDEDKFTKQHKYLIHQYAQVRRNYFALKIVINNQNADQNADCRSINQQIKKSLMNDEEFKILK